MRYPKTTLIAAASSLALLMSLALPAVATPALAPIVNASPDLILVKGGGGGHMGGGAHIGGPAGTHFAATGGARFAATPHMGNSFAHMGGNNARIARGNNFNANAGRHERFANNWNGNWNGNRHDHDHHHHFNRFYAYPFFYGGYYAYNGYGYGDCGWLYRRAVATGSPYWWNRYYACAG